MAVGPRVTLSASRGSFMGCPASGCVTGHTEALPGRANIRSAEAVSDGVTAGGREGGEGASSRLCLFCVRMFSPRTARHQTATRFQARCGENPPGRVDYKGGATTWTDSDPLVHHGTIYRRLGFTAHPKYLDVVESMGIIDVWEQRGPPDFCEKVGGEWVCE